MYLRHLTFCLVYCGRQCRTTSQPLFFYFSLCCTIFADSVIQTRHFTSLSFGFFLCKCGQKHDYCIGFIDFKNITLLTYYLAVLGLRLLLWLLSGCREQALLSRCGAWAPCCGVASCGAWALGSTDFSVVTACELSSSGSWTLEPRLNCCVTQAQLLHRMWDSPRSRDRILCLLYRQAYSLPLSCQGSPVLLILKGDMSQVPIIMRRSLNYYNAHLVHSNYYDVVVLG